MYFINRIDELNSLEKEYKRKGSSFVVLYGRRRLGKTRLLREFFQEKKGVFHASIEATRHIQLNRFRGQLADFLKDRFLEKSEITDWELLFDYLADRIVAQHTETKKKSSS